MVFSTLSPFHQRTWQGVLEDYFPFKAVEGNSRFGVRLWEFSVGTCSGLPATFLRNNVISYSPTLVAMEPDVAQSVLVRTVFRFSGTLWGPVGKYFAGGEGLRIYGGVEPSLSF